MIALNPFGGVGVGWGLEVGGGGFKAKQGIEKKGMRMERWRDRGAEGQKERVVGLKGLMSNERLSRPQLILSFYLYCGISVSPA